MKAGAERRRRLGTKQRRADDSHAREKEAARIHQREMETGAKGVFAVLNSALMRSSSPGATGYRAGVQNQPSKGVCPESLPKPTASQAPRLSVQKERLEQARLVQEVVSLERRVVSLREMVHRNAKDPVTLSRAKHSLTQAEQALRRQQELLQARSTASVAKQSLHRAWTKF